MPARRVAPLLLAVVVLAVACGGGTGSDASPSEPAPGPAPDATAPTPEGLEVADTLTFTADLIGGGELDAASLEGEPVVLWFWAPWCSTCRSEAPGVAAAVAEHDGAVRVVGVAGRGPVADMEQFVADTGTAGFDHVVDDDGGIWTSFGVISQPAYAFVAADGEVEVVQGAIGRDALEERMATLSQR